MTGEPPRRVVTGHDPSGRSVVLSDGPPPHTRRVPDGATFFELWATPAAPATIAADEPEPAPPGDELGPPCGGTRARIVLMPPGTRSPMHRTATVDYGIVLEGTVTLVLEDSEIAVAAGDLVVQRGTDHAWENRSETDARVLFVLIDGALSEALLATLPDDVTKRLA